MDKANMPYYMFSNAIGSFVFDDSFRVIDKILFKGVKDYRDKDSFESKLTVRYKEVRKPDNKEVKRILSYFKRKEFFADFYARNLEMTKKDVKDSVKEDILILHTINNIEEIDKVTSSMVKRLREWYELYCPEFSNRVDNHHTFVRLILTKDKKQLMDEINVKESMGADLGKRETEPIIALATRINDLYNLKESLEGYLERLMNSLCPNMKSITGNLIGAKLLEHTGSLRRLVELPASTIQILGAEKALFRHMTDKRSKPPKYGILFQHSLVQKVNINEKGKAARMLADKISIAVKVDYFKGKFVGDKLKGEIMERFGGF